MTKSELIQKLLESVKSERQVTLEVIRYLDDVEKQKIHLEMGFPSLFEFATKFLGYSEGAAFRRVKALKLIKHAPDVEKKILDGKLTLSAAASVEAFCNKHGIDRVEAIAKVEGLSTREAERALHEFAPSAAPDERVRRVSATHTEIRMSVSNEQLAELDRLKELFAHSNPRLTYGDLYMKLAAQELKKKDFARKPEDSKRESAASSGETSASAKRPAASVSESSTSAPKSNPRARAARGNVKRVVWQREGGGCSYVDPVSGRRCNSKHFAQTDHIRPWSHGGETVVENLRVLCAAHNRMEWERRDVSKVNRDEDFRSRPRT